MGLLLAVWAVVHTVRAGIFQPQLALLFGVFILFGEFLRFGRGVEPAPLGGAVGLAYALVGGTGAPQAVAVVVAAGLVGAVPHIARGRGRVLDHLARRVLTVSFAALCFQSLDRAGQVERWAGTGAGYVVFLVLVLALTGLCDAVLGAHRAKARTGYPYGPLLRDQLRSLSGTGSAVCATAAVLALAVEVAGPWALPVFCVPLLLTQLSVRRYAGVRATYRQTIASLARATEIAGYTPPGHARRVADLSRAVGRELGLSGAELTVLEYAALMHDIGQLSLVDPVPEGATTRLPAEEQRRIALLGGAVVRRTGVPAAVAVVVERQADPYREQPPQARIVRTVNAYDDLAGDSAAGALAALERLRLATAHEHHPEVVEALARVLVRGGLSPVPPG
ncbi:HD domain-containing protein [Streptomyces sp. NPDC001941]|uniref:HD-GYP domain-containing protein n=1 Tax=Streptomyces sp. NPDC001941 TaxID=3154659 RepID=UPI00331F3EBA